MRRRKRTKRQSEKYSWPSKNTQGKDRKCDNLCAETLLTPRRYDVTTVKQTTTDSKKGAHKRKEKSGGVWRVEKRKITTLNPKAAKLRVAS